VQSRFFADSITQCGAATSGIGSIPNPSRIPRQSFSAQSLQVRADLLLLAFIFAIVEVGLGSLKNCSACCFGSFIVLPIDGEIPRAWSVSNPCSGIIMKRTFIRSRFKIGIGTQKVNGASTGNLGEYH
jgi:hypothetical protein